jgi:hypothetical protein
VSDGGRERERERESGKVEEQAASLEKEERPTNVSHGKRGGDGGMNSG